MSKFPIAIENNQPIPPQRSTPATANFSVILKRLKPGQCYRIKGYDLFVRMAKAARTQNGKYGTAYVCRWLGAFGRIWNSAKSAKRSK